MCFACHQGSCVLWLPSRLFVCTAPGTPSSHPHICYRVTFPDSPPYSKLPLPTGLPVLHIRHHIWDD